MVRNGLSKGVILCSNQVDEHTVCLHILCFRWRGKNGMSNHLYYQENNIQYVRESLGTETWTTVCGTICLNKAEAAFWCGFMSKECLEGAMNQSGWDLSAHTCGGPGFEGNGETYIYKQNIDSDKGLEPLLFFRDFYGVKDSYIEISQEFILLNNLRFDMETKSYWAMFDDGQTDEVIQYKTPREIKIKTKYLKKYAAARQLCLVFYFDITTHVDGTLEDNGLSQFDNSCQESSLRYDIYGDQMNYPVYCYSRLFGKKVFMPLSVDKCGYWPYEKEKSYEEYIIGADDTGESILYSCNPDYLSNFFGANPEAPSYFTPVFFKREVLQRYTSKPELYEIVDGRLTCGSLWSIEIDNHHKDYLIAYLGDIGTYLPECEQQYWKSYNIPPEGSISLTTYARDFMNVFMESEMEDHRFVAKYVAINNQWKEIYGWPLFLPLSSEDQYNFDNIRIPLTDGHPEFDQLVLSLVKVLVDSINEKQLQKEISIDPNTKGISKLEEWIKANGGHQYESHVKFLRDIQELRSTGSGHRKGKGYEKMSREFGMDVMRLREVFESILKKANEFLDFMSETFGKHKNTLV